MITDEIFDLFARFGAGHYGENVSLERHMLQAAAMAEALSAPPRVVLAAVVHDIGYFLHAGAEKSLYAGHDFEHEALGAVWLSRAFDATITAPVALHVRAKRYLCAVEPPYYDALSDASRLSLAAQGGVMRAAELVEFTAHPEFESAILLRRCDDRGKDVGAKTRSLADYRALMMEFACDA